MKVKDKFLRVILAILVVLVCGTVSARPHKQITTRHYSRHKTTLVVKKGNCSCKKHCRHKRHHRHCKHVKRMDITRKSR